MYIVRFDEKDGYFGPFETRNEANRYLAICQSEGRVIHLVKPYAFGKVEEDEIEAAVSLASEHGGT